MQFTLNFANLTPIVVFNIFISLYFTLAYFYQVIYAVMTLLRGTVKLPQAEKLHRFAIFIAAHNEEAVIGNLVRSLLEQDYPHDLIDVFVVCDACTDNTHAQAQRAGAHVWDRHDLARKGKSWVMDYGFRRIQQEYGDRFDAFIIFDADNIAAPDYVRQMNDAYDAGYLVATSYRNSKNFDSSWVSASYAIWFMREARFLNNARMMAHTSAAISGAGWMVAASVIRGMQGWDFHTLTEDLQFSTFCCTQGIQIAYVPAEFFDEQPITFHDSWVQRLRWIKGNYQVFFSYGRDLFRGVAHAHFAAYDMMMALAPSAILTVLAVFINGSYLIVGSLSHGFIATDAELQMCMGSLLAVFQSSYLVFFVMGLVTVISERAHIHSRSLWHIVRGVFLFPLFMMSYIPINVVALFKKVEWVPTKHDIALDFQQVVGVTRHTSNNGAS